MGERLRRCLPPLLKKRLPAAVLVLGLVGGSAGCNQEKGQEAGVQKGEILTPSSIPTLVVEPQAEPTETPVIIWNQPPQFKGSDNLVSLAELELFSPQSQGGLPSLGQLTLVSSSSALDKLELIKNEQLPIQPAVASGAVEMRKIEGTSLTQPPSLSLDSLAVRIADIPPFETIVNSPIGDEVYNYEITPEIMKLKPRANFSLLDWNGQPRYIAEIPDNYWREAVIGAAYVNRGIIDKKALKFATLMVAVAESETAFNPNLNICNLVGACGVYQFIKETAERYGLSDEKRLDPRESAVAAAKMLTNMDLLEASDKEEFIEIFIGNYGEAWNMHRGHADYVWRVWQEFLSRSEFGGLEQRQLLTTNPVFKNSNQEIWQRGNLEINQIISVLDGLLGIPYKVSGYKDIQGNYGTLKGLAESFKIDKTKGLNCAGFVVEMMRSLFGRFYLSEVVQPRTDRPFTQTTADWLWYGYDLIKNLADKFGGKELEIAELGWQPGIGYPIENLKKVASKMTPGNIYLGSVNIPDPKEVRRHYHVLAILPLSQNEVVVYEATQEKGTQKLSLEEFIVKYPGKAIFLVEIPLGSLQTTNKNQTSSCDREIGLSSEQINPNPPKETSTQENLPSANQLETQANWDASGEEAILSALRYHFVSPFPEGYKLRVTYPSSPYYIHGLNVWEGSDQRYWGQDFMSSTDRPNSVVRAPFNGKITVFPDDGHGQSVEFISPNGTLMVHYHHVDPKNGLTNEVKAGQEIGRIRTVDGHIHAIAIANYNLDPSQWIIVPLSELFDQPSQVTYQVPGYVERAIISPEKLEFFNALVEQVKNLPPQTEKTAKSSEEKKEINVVADLFNQPLQPGGEIDLGLGVSIRNHSVETIPPELLNASLNLGPNLARLIRCAGEVPPDQDLVIIWADWVEDPTDAYSRFIPAGAGFLTTSLGLPANARAIFLRPQDLEQYNLDEKRPNAVDVFLHELAHSSDFTDPKKNYGEPYDPLILSNISLERLTGVCLK